MAVTLALVADGEETNVVLNMIEPYRHDTLGFFQAISRLGWSGSDSWESEFAEAAIVARSDGGGKVELDLTLRWNSYESTLTRTLSVDEAELGRFAHDVARFLHIDVGHRFQSAVLPKKRRRRR
jgi:hypothetical protein